MEECNNLGSHVIAWTWEYHWEILDTAYCASYDQKTVQKYKLDKKKVKNSISCSNMCKDMEFHNL